MNFERFKSLCRESWSSWDGSAIRHSLHPQTRKLKALAAAVEGMATENKMLLLNHAVSCLDSDEVYVEIGCWKGKSLVGAMFENTSQHAYACDNFSEFGGPRDELAANLSKYAATAHVEFHDQDFRTFLNSAPWSPKKVGVYFYDGGHTFAEQYEAIELMVPHLSSNALIIVDDTNLLRARRANRLVAHGVPGLEVIKHIPTKFNGELTWWNGLDLLHYRGRTSAPIPARPKRYEQEKVFWDGVAPVLWEARTRALKALEGLPGGTRLRHLYRSTRDRLGV